MPRHALRRRMVNTFLPTRTLPLGGRKFFFHQNLSHWGRGPGWPVVRDSFLPNPGGKNVISETSRQNLLKFCIRLPMTILRTNPYWHFAQKTQKVGQNLSFLVKKWRFFEKKNFSETITRNWFTQRKNAQLIYCWALHEECVYKFSSRSEKK